MTMTRCLYTQAVICSGVFIWSVFFTWQLILFYRTAMLCYCATVLELWRGVLLGGGAIRMEGGPLGGATTYSVSKYCHVSMAPPFLMEPRCARR